ncbi:MAG: hypothetical protein RIQ46_595 [Pseudomonadota bacterium]
MDQSRAVEEAAERAIELEAERESAGIATTGGNDLDEARLRLREWVDSVVGVVAAAGSGRVTLIHANGRTSGIASADLARMLTPPARFEASE